MSRRAINITFHGVGEPERRLDAGEASVWVGRSQFHALLDEAAARPDVAITFDDGNDSDVEQALPALIDRGLKATFFIVAGRLGSHGFVDEHGVRELRSAGMPIGCHGMLHTPWRGLDRAALHRELVDARAALQDILGEPITEAACPFGSYDRRVLQALRRAGYRRAYSSDGGTATPADFLQPRNSLGPEDRAGAIAKLAQLDVAPSARLRRRAKIAVKRWR